MDGQQAKICKIDFAIAVDVTGDNGFADGAGETGDFALSIPGVADCYLPVLALAPASAFFYTLRNTLPSIINSTQPLKAIKGASQDGVMLLIAHKKGRAAVYQTL